ncbi:hypothetical protein BJ875DRAFT_484450 [Amylocarpus encephaloides]|uniref:Uncharacterized protein n=1 Tax=Amylocarpus encephaloides TaxID=45428 RepID=A0A9P7YIG6_9HELO|nr:hypothetical protein BJ875DRAFT_484450 [Amylocarpus encephaloides]
MSKNIASTIVLDEVEYHESNSTTRANGFHTKGEDEDIDNMESHGNELIFMGGTLRTGRSFDLPVEINSHEENFAPSEAEQLTNKEYLINNGALEEGISTVDTTESEIIAMVRVQAQGNAFTNAAIAGYKSDIPATVESLFQGNYFADGNDNGQDSLQGAYTPKPKKRKYTKKSEPTNTQATAIDSDQDEDDDIPLQPKALHARGPTRKFLTKARKRETMELATSAASKNAALKTEASATEDTDWIDAVEDAFGQQGGEDRVIAIAPRLKAVPRTKGTMNRQEVEDVFEAYPFAIIISLGQSTGST